MITMGQDRKSKRERKSVEILPIINKPKAPTKKKKREHKEQSERTHSKDPLASKKTKRNTSKRPNHKGNIKFPNPIEFLYPLPVARSISNKERGGLPERKRHEEDTKQKEEAEGVPKYQTDIHIHNMPNYGHKGFTLVTYGVNPLTTSTSHYLASYLCKAGK